MSRCHVLCLCFDKSMWLLIMLSGAVCCKYPHADLTHCSPRLLEQDDMGTDNNDIKWTNTKMDALPSIQILSYHHNHNTDIWCSVVHASYFESSFLLATNTTVNVSQSGRFSDGFTNILEDYHWSVESWVLGGNLIFSAIGPGSIMTIMSVYTQTAGLVSGITPAPDLGDDNETLSTSLSSGKT